MKIIIISRLAILLHQQDQCRRCIICHCRYDGRPTSNR